MEKIDDFYLGEDTDDKYDDCWLYKKMIDSSFVFKHWQLLMGVN